MSVLKTYAFELDIINKNPTPTMEFYSGDLNSNVLIINLTNNATPLDITGFNAKLSICKADGTMVIQDSSNGLSIQNASTGQIKVVLLTQSINAVGVNSADISIYNSSEKLTTSEFKFNVKLSKDDIALPSINVIPMIDTELELMETARQNLLDTNDSVVSAENARQASFSNFISKDNYDPSTPYSKNNIVTLNGSSYMAKEDELRGISPDSDSAKWQLMASKGSQGNAGAQGLQGMQGIQGLKGDKGDAGSQGIQGIKGDKGDQGIQGIQGERGASGTATASEMLVADVGNHFTSTDVEGCLAELFQSASDLKSNVVSGITGIGGTADTSMTGVQLKNAISDTLCPTWVKPADWIDIMADVPSNGVSFLVNDTGGSTYGFVATTSSGQYQVNWGDGNTTTHDSGINASHTYLDGTGQACSRGYATFKVKITPVSGDLLSVKVADLGPVHYYGILWCAVGTTTLTDCSNMFYNGLKGYCLQLEQFSVSNVDNTRNVTTTRQMFNTCRLLKSVNLFNTSKVTDMSFMFASCYSLRKVPLFDTSKVTDMSYMFTGCYNLPQVPQFDTSNVVYMTGMFRMVVGVTVAYAALKNVPFFNTANVTKMDSMFYGCNLIETVPLFNTSKVVSMYGMFGGCVSLKSVPQFDTINVTNMSPLVSGCSALINFPTLNTPNLTTFALTSCQHLKSILITNGTFSDTNSPQISLSNCGLSASAINALFASLPIVTGKMISVAGCPGAATCDISIAAARGWSVI